MIFHKGDLLNIDHKRKGLFKAIATSDFSTDDKWYPVVVAPDGYVKGLAHSRTSLSFAGWEEGDAIPCRASQVTFILKEEILDNPDA